MKKPDRSYYKDGKFYLNGRNNDKESYLCPCCEMMDSECTCIKCPVGHNMTAGECDCPINKIHRV